MRRAGWVGLSLSLAVLRRALSLRQEYRGYGSPLENRQRHSEEEELRVPTQQ